MSVSLTKLSTVHVGSQIAPISQNTQSCGQKIKACFQAFVDLCKRVWKAFWNCICCRSKTNETSGSSVVEETKSQSKPVSLKVETQKSSESINGSIVNLLPEKEITDGYGELILRVKEGDSLRPVTKEEYAKAYKIFQKYAPRLQETPAKQLKSRITLMREELKTIDPNLIGTFVPRTLHDLIFIRKAIEEDLEKEKKYPFKDPAKPTEKEESLVRESWYLKRNSWCNVKSPEEGYIGLRIQMPSCVEENLDRLLDIGHRLNTAACEILSKKAPNKEHLQFGEIRGLVEEQIQFLHSFFNNPRYQNFANCTNPGLSSNFLQKTSERGNLKPMAVNDEKNAQIIRDASTLECSEIAQGKIIIYRGGDLKKDSPVRNGNPYCMSFGSGLFPGAVNDGGATAYHYIRKREGYAIVLDPEIESSKFFLTPPYTALESLFGHGETWHYRIKYSKDEKGKIDGIDGADGFPIFKTPLSKMPSVDKFEEIIEDQFAIFKTPLSRQQLVDKFEELKKRNFFILKST